MSRESSSRDSKRLFSRAFEVLEEGGEEGGGICFFCPFGILKDFSLRHFQQYGSEN